MSVIRTIFARELDLENPNPDDILIEDIAISLSQINRFVGHTAFPFSVAQHSIRMCRVAMAWHSAGMPSYEGSIVEIIPLCRAVLMHDATEAYLGDVSAPLKHLPQMQGYRELEAKWARVIADRFQCGGYQDIVRALDLAALHDEGRVLRYRCIDVHGKDSEASYPVWADDAMYVYADPVSQNPWCNPALDFLNLAQALGIGSKQAPLSIVASALMGTRIPI